MVSLVVSGLFQHAAGVTDIQPAPAQALWRQNNLGPGPCYSRFTIMLTGKPVSKNSTVKPKMTSGATFGRRLYWSKQET
jgi:hypothetical protein